MFLDEESTFYNRMLYCFFAFIGKDNYKTNSEKVTYRSINKVNSRSYFLEGAIINNYVDPKSTISCIGYPEGQDRDKI